MPIPLSVIDLTAVAIDTVHGTNVDSWWYQFKSVDDTIIYGHIFDNINSFVDGSVAGSALPVKLLVTSGSENRAIVAGDTLTITVDTVVKTIRLPAITGGGQTIYYIDSNGYLYTDAALTVSADGMVGAVNETMTFSDSVAVQEYGEASESMVLTDEFEAQEINEASESMVIFDTFEQQSRGEASEILHVSENIRGGQTAIGSSFTKMNPTGSTIWTKIK